MGHASPQLCLLAMFRGQRIPWQSLIANRHLTDSFTIVFRKNKMIVPINQVPLQFTMKGLKKLINSEVLIPSFRSISPPPNQKKSGLSFTIASSRITGMSVLMPIHVTPLCSYPVNFREISSGASLKLNFFFGILPPLSTNR